jgi:thiamine-phosphate pyrophosphorylase
MAIVTDAAGGLYAVRKGANVLQLRDPGARLRRLEDEAYRLVAEAGVPVLISSRADLVLAAGAAGVQLPDGDLPVAAARRLLGPARLIGRSVHSLEAAEQAEAAGAQYLVFGPVFPTASHPGRQAAGLAALGAVAAAVRIPVLAIGGIDRARAQACLEAGASGFAAIGYFRGR